ncbi:putative histone deacetylase [Helianthus debilis subsp. tardiflorus]
MGHRRGVIPLPLGKTHSPIKSLQPLPPPLNLDGNRISGKLPATLLNSSISILNLSRNGIEGNIPDAFGPRSYFPGYLHNNCKIPIA